MKFALVILSAILCFQLEAQSQLTITGRVTDADSKMPLAECFVRIEGTPYSANSDENGYYKIVCTQAIDSFSLSCRKFNYDTFTQTGITGVKTNESKKIKVDFVLRFSSYMLPDVSISASPDTVWGDANLNVADFAFAGKNLLLLTYQKEDRWKKQEDSKVTLYSGCFLVLLDSNKKEVDRLSVAGQPTGFYVDYFDDIFLDCREKIYYISMEPLSLTLMVKEDFDKGIKPVIDTTQSLTCFSNYDADYPAFEYMIFNNKDSSYHTFRYMIDEKMMEMFRSEFKYLDPRGKLEAFRFEVETGIDKEIVAAYMNGFQNTYYYEPLNTPLIVSNDTLLIFDHHHDKMIRFNWEGQALDSVLIDYHKTKRPEKWSEKLLKDKTTQHVYTYYSSHGFSYIRKINTHSGEAEHPVKLTYRYVEEIRIMDGYAYYIYRPFESSQKRFLYRESIRSEY